MHKNFTSKEIIKENHLPCLLIATRMKMPRLNFLLKIMEKGNTWKGKNWGNENPVILHTRTKMCQNSSGESFRGGRSNVKA